MIISKLKKEEYEGKQFIVRYTTKGYYDIQRVTTGFEFTYTEFDDEKEVSFEDSFFNEWLEEPVAYGAFEDGELIGFVEGSIEGWNNRYRISNICVFKFTSYIIYVFLHFSNVSAFKVVQVYCHHTVIRHNHRH